MMLRSDVPLPLHASPSRPLAARQRRTRLVLATALVAVAAPGWAADIDGGAVEIVDGDGLAGAGGTGTQPSPWNPFSVIVGNHTTGELRIIAGGEVSTELSQSYIGNQEDSNGTVTVTGTDSSWTNDDNLIVGNSGTGTLTIADGGAVSNRAGYIGLFAGSTGTVSVTGTGSSWTNAAELTVGRSGTGTLTIAEGGVVQASGVTVASSGTSSGTLNIGAAASDAAVAAGTLTAPTVAFGAGTGKLVFNHTDTDYTFAAAISGAGSVNVLSGTTKLTGANTYSGGTTISAGTLQIGNGGTVGSLRGNVTNNSALIFNRSDALSYTGDISGTGSLTKSGTGTLTLTGASSHTGGTTISGGTLQVGNGGTTGSLSGNVTNNNALSFNRSDALSYGGVISGTGSLTKSGTGTLTLTGANTYDGTTSVTGGTLSVSADNNLGDGALTLNGGNFAVTGATTIDNAIALSSSATITNSADATLSGVISGAGALTKAGVSTLTLSGANSFSGGMTVSAGTISLGAAERLADAGGVNVNAGATFDLNNFNERIGGLAGAGSIVLGTGNLTAGTASSSTFSGDISGTGSLTKSGTGTTKLTGANTYTGGTTVSGGTLSVNGSTGAITLNGGTLGGSGTVGNVIANSGSTIAPGNSIGTLNVAGDTSFAAGSTYAVEVDRNGNADKIAATGTVTIDNGATVTVSAENGTDDGSTYAVATTYTIVSAGTAVTGTFGSVSENFAFLDASLSYDANSVYLKLLRNNFSFASSATTANQRETAGALDTLVSGNTLYDAVSVLSTASARSAFDALSGEIHASANGVLMQNSSFSRDAVVARMRGTFDGVAEGDESQAYGRAAVWGHAYGNWGHTDSDGNAARLTHSAGGFYFGADGGLPGDWVAGIFAGYGASSFASSARASSGTANSYELGSYTGNRFGNLGVRLGGSVAWHDVAAARNVKFGSFSEALSAEYSAATAQVFGELSYTLDTGVVRFEPFAGAALVYQHSNGFSETGGAAALNVASASQTLGLTTLGLRAETHLGTTEGFTASLSGSLGWRHAFGDIATSANMRFASGDAFRIAGTAIDRDTALIEAGLKLDFNGSARLDLNYQGDLGASTQNHGFNAKFSASF